MIAMKELLPEAVCTRLRWAGLTGAALQEAVAAFEAVREALPWGTGIPRAGWAAFVPGRIEVVGKHTDYAGGSSLVCAVDRGCCLAAIPGRNRGLWVCDATTGETATFPVAAGLPLRVGHWSRYPQTVARRLARNFGDGLVGGHLAFAGTLPQAAGLSSSSALIVGTALALAAMNGLTADQRWRDALPDRTALAAYLAAVENGSDYGPLAGDDGVGTRGGAQDHLAILCSEPGALTPFGYDPVRKEAPVPWPEGWGFVVGVSGVRAEKTGAARAAYNRAATLARAVTAAWNAATGRADPHLGAILRSPGFDPDRVRHVLAHHPPPGFDTGALLDRFEHFVREHGAHVPAAVADLRAGDLAAFGRAVDASMADAGRLLKNQVPETVFLARAAREAGAGAASAFGAGFGGAVWALVPADGAGAFREAWAARYADAFPHREGRFFETRPGPPAFFL